MHDVSAGWLMTVTGAITPWSLIVFTFGLGAGTAMMLPAWIRARGLAVYLASFMGSMAIGSATWGRLASATDTATAGRRLDISSRAALPRGAAVG